MILVIVYMIAGYWAVGQTIWRGRTFIEFKQGAYFVQRATMGAILGWILIPVAVIRMLLSR